MTNYMKADAAHLSAYAEAIGVASLYIAAIGSMMYQVALAAGYVI